ncbi:MAG: helix-turn-helix transcriptional regulator [Clostridia bacterium]|nr:helix-turn-helix transcriptional regulator [Clostridia bacterium]
MTVGEKIQIYRKRLGLSQDELGQRMLVSRQTISLWEKNQTVPTIDNLIRLKEIFNVSVDDILGFDGNERADNILPDETYRFNFTKDEIKEIQSLQGKGLYRKPVLSGLICVALIAYLIFLSAPEILIGFAVGIVFIGTFFHIKRIITYNKAWRKSVEKICQSVYEYKFFEDYIIINIYRENEKVRESKCYFKDIEKIQQFGKWLFFQFGGQSFIVRKRDLKENSAFYSYMYKNPTKTIDSPVPNKWRVMSIILFVASLFSILGALVLVNTVSTVNGLFIENMWLFFLLTPVPIASTVFGFVLKSKGLKYKKNVIAGVIMTVLLCIYGSFTFIF